jgi:hypothetical protein
MYHTETPLHWVASSDDVEAFELLVKAGADIEALGGSIGGGTPLDNAVGYGQWRVARRLIECGARTKLWHAAALGLMSCVETNFGGDAPPTPQEITTAFYQACAGVNGNPQNTCFAGALISIGFPTGAARRGPLWMSPALTKARLVGDYLPRIWSNG